MTKSIKIPRCPLLLHLSTLSKELPKSNYHKCVTNGTYTVCVDKDSIRAKYRAPNMKDIHTCF